MPPQIVLLHEPRRVVVMEFLSSFRLSVCSTPPVTEAPFLWSLYTDDARATPLSPEIAAPPLPVPVTLDNLGAALMSQVFFSPCGAHQKAWGNAPTGE